jgi:hypothetical protein
MTNVSVETVSKKKGRPEKEELARNINVYMTDSEVSIFGNRRRAAQVAKILLREIGRNATPSDIDEILLTNTIK